MWFDVDDRLPGSPELLSIPRRYRAAAIGVWSLCGAWTSGQLTDGFVPNEVIKECGGTSDIRGWLVKAGLWNDGPDGITFTGRGCRVPNAQDVRKRRATTAQRVRDWREAQRESQADSDPPAETARCNGVTPDNVTVLLTRRRGKGKSVGTSVDSAVAESTDDPTKETKLTTSQAESLRKSGTETARARRIPEDWEPSESVKADLRARYPELKLGLVLEEFRDYWRGEGGQRARKIDWTATFRNRVRAVEHEPRFQRNGHAVHVATSDQRVAAILAKKSSSNDQLELT